MRKENNLKGERERGVRDGIVGLGLSRGILSYGLAKPAFFPVRRLGTLLYIKLGLEQIRSAYNMGIQLGRGRRRNMQSICDSSGVEIHMRCICENFYPCRAVTPTT